MSRYRPPSPPSSKYITPEGERALKEELRYLWKEERPRVTQSVAEAAALGDRSENAEYIYGKKRLREIDRRVRYLDKRLQEITRVSAIPDNPDKVYFGAYVTLMTLEDESQQHHRYRLVGADEIDPKRGYISIDSPMAKALLGKAIEQEVTVETPAGQTGYFILAIDYQ